MEILYVNIAIIFNREENTLMKNSSLTIMVQTVIKAVFGLYRFWTGIKHSLNINFVYTSL